MRKIKEYWKARDLFHYTVEYKSAGGSICNLLSQKSQQKNVKNSLLVYEKTLKNT